jgi:hypothetical protein
MYNYYNYLEPCASNAEFLHFIPRFNRTSFADLTQRGDRGEQKPKDKVKTG